MGSCHRFVSDATRNGPIRLQSTMDDYDLVYLMIFVTCSGPWWIFFATTELLLCQKDLPVALQSQTTTSKSEIREPCFESFSFCAARRARPAPKREASVVALITCKRAIALLVANLDMTATRANLSCFRVLGTRAIINHPPMLEPLRSERTNSQRRPESPNYHAIPRVFYQPISVFLHSMIVITLLLFDFLSLMHSGLLLVMHSSLDPTSSVWNRRLCPSTFGTIDFNHWSAN